MAGLYRQIGLILNRHNLGHVDRRITLLTARGKFELKARGTQKLASKLAGSLEPLTLVDVTIARGRSMDQITGSSIKDSYPSIHQHVPKIAAAALLASAAELLVRGETEDGAVYKRIRESMVLVSRSTTNREVFLAVSYGLLNVLSTLGYRPVVADQRTTPAVRRLIGVLLRGQVNTVRRIRCSVTTARTATMVALHMTEATAERRVPAAAFFWQALTRSTSLSQ